MPFTRTSRMLPLNRSGKRFFPASKSGLRIRLAVESGQLATQDFTLAESQRLDLVAANYYGDASYWWVIAAASGIGWQCQVPPGTRIRIPTRLSDVEALVG